MSGVEEEEMGGEGRREERSGERCKERSEWWGEGMREESSRKAESVRRAAGRHR